MLNIIEVVVRFYISRNSRQLGQFATSATLPPTTDDISSPAVHIANYIAPLVGIIVSGMPR